MSGKSYMTVLDLSDGDQMVPDNFEIEVVENEKAKRQEAVFKSIDHFGIADRWEDFM